MEENNKEKSTIGIAGFVLGIISILSALFWYITLPSGILAIIFGAKSVKRIGSLCFRLSSNCNSSLIIFIFHTIPSI